MLISDVMAVLEKYAPLRYSREWVEKGAYDNSGIIINNHEEIKGILFSLDLSVVAIKKAKANSCDTIITHHPAIYHPIKNLDVNSPSSVALLQATKLGLNVISMHLNLDIAENGIDESLAKGLGAEKTKILEQIIDSSIGYGREFEIEETTFEQFKRKAMNTLNAKRVLTFGSAKQKIKKVASFCGAGSGDAISYIERGGQADLIVTADAPHHAIKQCIESGKCLMTPTHYAIENYGFNIFYQSVTKEINEKSFIFTDERFL